MSEGSPPSPWDLAVSSAQGPSVSSDPGRHDPEEGDHVNLKPVILLSINLVKNPLSFSSPYSHFIYSHSVDSPHPFHLHVLYSPFCLSPIYLHTPHFVNSHFIYSAPHFCLLLFHLLCSLLSARWWPSTHVPHHGSKIWWSQELREWSWEPPVQVEWTIYGGE